MLKPGNLPINGDSSPFNGSLAAAIESQLNQLLFDDKIDPLPTDDSLETRDRRRMFVAIARGVLQHLKENQTSIQIQVGGGITLTPNFVIDGL